MLDVKQLDEVINITSEKIKKRIEFGLEIENQTESIKALAELVTARTLIDD